MKKLLSILAATTLLTGSAFTVVSCTDGNGENETVTPEETKTKIDWTQEEFLQELGNFTYEVDSSDETKTILKSTDNKTPLFLEGGDENNKKFEHTLEENDVHLLPYDVLPNPSYEKPYGEDLFTVLTFDKEIYENAFVKESHLHPEFKPYSKFLAQTMEMGTNHNWGTYQKKNLMY